jgi:tetratricopeptide (TPR) repeat protein
MEQGIADYSRGDWNQALVSFEQVRAWDANYKNVNQYYQKTLLKLRSTENDNLKMQYYQQGKNHLQKGENEIAIEVFTRLMELDSKFRDVRSLRDRAFSQLDEKSRQEHFYTLYAEGLEHLRNEEWLQATVVFEEAKHINPGDTLLLQKLAEAEMKLKEATMADAVRQQEVSRQQDPESKSNYLWLFGVIAVAIALPTVIVLKSPTRKAAGYFKRGAYQNAALLYEALLLKNPYNTKVHLALANVYLKMDRNDGHARKIYSMALQQKLDPYLRKEIYQKMSSQVTSTLEPGQNPGDVGIWLKNELDNLK